MDDAFLKGYAFELSDIWRSSDLLAADSENIFLEPLDIDLPELKSNVTSGWVFEDLKLDSEAFGIAGGVDENNVLIDHDLSPGPTAEHVSADFRSDSAEPDVWILDLTIENEELAPALFSWELFEQNDVANRTSVPFLSEAGARVFDAALVNRAHDQSNQGVLPQDVMLRALSALTLGRSSVFFQWNEKQKRFERTLKDIPISGMSPECSETLIHAIADCGSMFRNLAGFAAEINSRERSCTAFVALRRCIASILESLDRSITLKLPEIRSLLQLQDLADKPSQILSALCRLIESIEECSTDEEVISSTAHQVCQLTATGHLFSEILGLVLARLSAPWLERLSNDLGLGHASIRSSSDSRSFPLQEESDDIHEELGDRIVDRLGSLDFITEDDQSLIRETKTSLKILRQHLPAGDSSIRPNVKLLPLVHALNEDSYRKLRTDVTIVEDNSISEALVWADSNSQHAYLADLDARMGQRPSFGMEEQDGLHQAVTSAVQLSDNGTVAQPLRQLELGLDPLESLRPLIRAQNQLVNISLLRFLFKDCDVRRHLDLQKQYHLFGNGNFVSQLTHALFSADVQSAKRSRSNMPTGETMGLQLGARESQQWPPASSELRLTLMGILEETYHSNSGKPRKRQGVTQLPSGLSFSIRELSDTEIERVMDASSIYALDFLRLSYAAPPPLDAVLTSSSLKAYDEVFRVLLKLVRVLYVATKLCETHALNKSARGTSKCGSGVRMHATDFVTEVQHFMSVLMSHFMDVGIEAPWRRFLGALDTVEKCLDFQDNGAELAGDTDTVGLDRLRRMHENCLRSIRNRLFLQRKHEKLRIGLENVLTDILRCAAALDDDQRSARRDFSAKYEAFQDSMHTFVSQLQGAVDKPPKGKSVTESAEDDIEGMRALLMRLKWNNPGEDDDEIM